MILFLHIIGASLTAILCTFSVVKTKTLTQNHLLSLFNSILALSGFQVISGILLNIQTNTALIVTCSRSALYFGIITITLVLIARKLNKSINPIFAYQFSLFLITMISAI